MGGGRKAKGKAKAKANADMATILAIRAATKKVPAALQSPPDDASALQEILAEIEVINTMEMKVAWEDEKEALDSFVSLCGLCVLPSLAAYPTGAPPSLSLSFACSLARLLACSLPLS